MTSSKLRSKRHFYIYQHRRSKVKIYENFLYHIFKRGNDKIKKKVFIISDAKIPFSNHI